MKRETTIECHLPLNIINLNRTTYKLRKHLLKSIVNAKTEYFISAAIYVSTG